MPATVRSAVRRVAAVFALTLTTVLLTAGLSPAQATPAATNEGWIRLAHLSPDTPKVDVYLASFGRPEDPTVLKGVGYGVVSPYQKVPAGSYTVAMRAEGAPATDPPVLSTTVQIAAGTASTVAGMGQMAQIKLVIIPDDLSAPPAGQSKLRVIQAAMGAPTIDVVEVAGTSVTGSLDFTETTNYSPLSAGATTIRVAAGTVSAQQPITLLAGSSYTVVVRDVPGGLGLVPLHDFAAAGTIPVGAVDAGEGGLTVDGGGSPALAATAGLVAAAALLGAIVLRRRSVRSV